MQKFLTVVLMLGLSALLTAAQNANAVNANVRAIANANVAVPDLVIQEPPARSTVRGRVFYGDTGRPVRRASVMLLPEDAVGGGMREAAGLTDGEGNFQIKNVRAGTYFPMVNAPGVVSPMAYADFTKLGPGGTEKEAFEGAFAEFEKIVVNGLTDVDVQIPAKRGGAISGRVSYEDGEAAIGVKVEIQRKEGDAFVPVIPNLSAIMSLFSGASNQTDDRGVYRFSGLPRGDYRVRVTENISHSDSKVSDGYNDPLLSIMSGGNSVVSIYYPDLVDAENAKTVAVELGAEQFDINVVIPNHNLYRLAGKVVTGKDKKPLKNATVSLRRKGDTETSIFNQFGLRRQSSTADEEGNWSFKELPKGEYELRVEAPPIETTYEGMTDVEMAVSAANMANTIVRKPNSPQPAAPKYAKTTQELTILDKDIAGIEIVMGFGATMSGTVTVENSREMPNGVSIHAAGGNEEEETSDSIGDPDEYGGSRGASRNSFKLENVAVGKTRLSVIVSDEDFYVKSASFEGRDLLAGAFELKEGDKLAGIKIVLAKDVGTLSGKVLNANKEPAKRVQFILVPTDAVKRRNISFYREVTTDENGEFKTKAPGREYAVLFGFARAAKAKKSGKFDKWLDDAIAAAQKVTIKENDTTTVKLTATY